MNALEAKKLTSQAKKQTVNIEPRMARLHKSIEAAAKKGESQVEIDFGRTFTTDDQMKAIRKQLIAEGFNVNADRRGVRTISW